MNYFLLFTQTVKIHTLTVSPHIFMYLSCPGLHPGKLWCNVSLLPDVFSFCLYKVDKHDLTHSDQTVTHPIDPWSPKTGPGPSDPPPVTADPHGRHVHNARTGRLTFPGLLPPVVASVSGERREVKSGWSRASNSDRRFIQEQNNQQRWSSGDKKAK